MINIRNKYECYGCNACREICPKQCITMKKDYKGFLYPQVNKSQCINCGLCEKVCPYSKEQLEFNLPLKAFAAWNKDREAYLKSSSGGAGYVISSHVLSVGGVVYGCCAEKTTVKHIRIDNQKDLYKLQGSKYVQSEVRGIFKSIKDDIKSGLTVLFIGTPCQIAGLKNSFKKVPEKLILVDLICHGVPSQQMMQSHFNNVSNNRKIEEISFRKGNEFVIELKSNSFYYSASMWNDLYYKAFMSGVIYRNCCYKCKFASSNRVGDITIGDFWGLKATYENIKNTNNGISLILPCTHKGIEILERIKSNLYIYERPLDEAIEGNEQLRHPTKITNKSRIFTILYTFLSFDYSLYVIYLDNNIKSIFIRICNKLNTIRKKLK